MNSPTKLLVFLLSVSASLSAVSQTEHRMFTYPGGQVASEGTMVDGKPDGYWKTYHENGRLKSEGNRVDGLLDGLWLFYSDDGDTTLAVNYSKGMKQGVRTSYSPAEIVEEPFEADVRSGVGGRYDRQRRLLQTVTYKKGFEEGLSPVFDTTGLLREVVTYRKGFVVGREVLNRYDGQGKRHGYWKTFFDDWSLRTECYYRHGLLDGFYKEYDKHGNLKKITRYANGVEQLPESGMKPLTVEREYHPNGQVRREASFRDGVKEGVWREFDENGRVVASQTYKDGVLLSRGIVGTDGKRQGEYKEFYPDSTLRVEGQYADGERTGLWKYYYPDSRLEQQGRFEQGLQQGPWTWYYDNGRVQIEENYHKGVSNGSYKEFDTAGREIVSGTYFDGLKAGKWVERIGDMRSEGEYRNGMRVGEWVSYYDDGKMAFKGSFNAGYPEGQHCHYHANGRLRELQSYAGGVRHGEWKKYLDTGELYFTITYDQDVEVRYDGEPLSDDEIVRQ